MRLFGRADVDPEIRHLGSLLPIGELHDVNGFLADDAEDVAAPPDESDSLADEDLRVPTADRRRINESVVIDVLNDQPDLVDVPIEHDRWRSAGVDLGHAVARDVRRDAFGKARCFFAPDARGRSFES
jgi:hypothetical protein